MILSKIIATKTAPIKYTTASPPGTKNTYSLLEVTVSLVLFLLAWEGLCTLSGEILSKPFGLLLRGELRATMLGTESRM